MVHTLSLIYMIAQSAHVYISVMSFCVTLDIGGWGFLVVAIV